MREDRLAALEHYMRENARASLPELCGHFGVSLNTVRRDIAELVERGVVSKVYGGIVLRQQEGDVVPLTDRKSQLRAEKARIGRMAPALVQDGSTIYIDSGTTAPMLLPYLKSARKVTVLSNSQAVYAVAGKYPNLQFISPGGLYNPSTDSFVGSSTIAALGSFQFSTAFMGATAFSRESGAMNNSYHEAEVKRAVIGRASRVALMIDHTKLDRQAGISFCEMEDLDYLVCDHPLPRDLQGLEPPVDSQTE